MKDIKAEKLRDRSMIKESIIQDKCIFCGGNKVGLDGVCMTCYLGLSNEHRKMANEESSHKKVTLVVVDDREDRRILKELFIRTYLEFMERHPSQGESY